ncbi:MAG: glycosyltransferase family 39 protein [Acidobacteria bacterium]|nr:glycosyltransferase family 39 protein [Acidobacteriota bacterium]
MAFTGVSHALQDTSAESSPDAVRPAAGVVNGRGFFAALAALAALAATLQVLSIRDETQTFDEDVHLAAGYSYWKTGDYRLNKEHPPLVKLLCAAPLLWMRPDLRLDDAWKQARQDDVAPVFLYANRIPAGRMLFAARTVSIAITLLLIAAVGLWTRALFGAVPGIFAALLVALDPNILAHGRYVTNDVPAALAWLVSIAAWVRYLTRKRPLDLLWAGLALGLALATKFSTVLLLPAFAVIYAFRAWQEDGKPGGLSVDRFCASMLAACALAGVVVLAVYGTPPWSYPRLETEIAPELAALRSLAAALRLPAHPFLAGLADVALHNRLGHATYLLGKVSLHGWWYYFPVAFAVKTPTAPLLLSLVALPAAALRWRELRRAPLAPVRSDLAVLLYFAVSMGSGINLGIRHLLPVYPLLYVLLAGFVWRLRRAALPVLLCVSLAQAAECARIHPYYLAFFNTPSGGPARGPEYLLDSNIDWGQDLLRLKRYMDARGVRQPCLMYFGRAGEARFFENPLPLPRGDVAVREQPNCLAAISATLLHDVYLKPGDFAWLRARKPVARVGYSIYVYDLRRPSLQP